MTELLPCPFCGGEAYPVRFIGLQAIWCKQCKNKTDTHDTDIEAIEAWNRRAESKAEELTVDQLKRMDQERVWVQLPEIGMYALVSYLTDEDYSSCEDFEELWFTNSLGGRDSYDQIAEQDGKVYTRKPDDQGKDTA